MAGTPNFSNRTVLHGENPPFLRGLNSETIRPLHCSSCNRIKSARLTLSGLRAANKKRRRMAIGG